jgi:hypothetical protein
MELTFVPQENKFQIIDKKEYGTIKPHLIYDNDSLSIQIVANIARYNYNDYRVHKSLYVPIYLKSKLNLKFDADSIKIIDNAGLELYPHAHSIYHKNNLYKKNKKHGLGIVFRSSSDDLTLPIYLYLPKIQLLKNDTVIKNIKFNKIEMNVKRIQE